MNRYSKIFVTGHRGLVGSAIVRALAKRGFENVLTQTHVQLDLCDRNEVQRFFDRTRPEYIFMCAARVGGIKAHTSTPVRFSLDNFRIQENVMESAQLFDSRKLLFLGSACAYPKLAPVPISEDALLTGPLEPSNEGYALAKISGVRMCDYYRRQYGCDFISCMPTNLYGPGDNYNLQSSHVLPGMMHRIHLAAEFCKLWGSGNPRREFLHSDDLAEACIFLMHQYSQEGHINVGFGSSVSLKELAAMLAKEMKFQGGFLWDTSQPDGTPNRLLDSSRIFNMGWKPAISLEDGIHRTYHDFLSYLQGQV